VHAWSLSAPGPYGHPKADNFFWELPSSIFSDILPGRLGHPSPKGAPPAAVFQKLIVGVPDLGSACFSLLFDIFLFPLPKAYFTHPWSPRPFPPPTSPRSPGIPPEDLFDVSPSLKEFFFFFRPKTSTRRQEVFLTIPSGLLAFEGHPQFFFFSPLRHFSRTSFPLRQHESPIAVYSLILSGTFVLLEIRHFEGKPFFPHGPPLFLLGCVFQIFSPRGPFFLGREDSRCAAGQTLSCWIIPCSGSSPGPVFPHLQGPILFYLAFSPRRAPFRFCLAFSFFFTHDFLGAVACPPSRFAGF